MLYDQSKDYNPVGLNLLASAKYLEEHGHCKFYLEREGKVCLQGALQAVIYGNPCKWEWLSDPKGKYGMMSSCLEALDKAKALPSDAGSALGRLVQWNNAKETTGQDVIDLFREAAELCKA